MSPILLASLLLTRPPTGADVDATPYVLMVKADPGSGDRDQRLATELMLVLDHFAVVTIEPPVQDFLDRSKQAQVYLLRPEAERYNAVAVVWLEPVSDKVVLLHLTAHRTGRTLRRTIESTTPERANERLALAVRAMLGRAYVDAPDDVQVEPALAQVVEWVRSQPDEAAPPRTAETAPAPAPPPAPPPRPGAPTWSYGISGTGEGAAVSASDPWLLGGLRLSVERRLRGRVRAGVSLEGQLGPYTTSEPRLFGLSAGEAGDQLEPVAASCARYAGQGVGAALYTAYDHPVGQGLLGLQVGAEARLKSLDFDVDADRRFVFPFWQGAAHLRLRGAGPATGPVRPVASAGLTWLPSRAVFLRRSTGEAVVSTPALLWSVSVGLQFASRM